MLLAEVGSAQTGNGAPNGPHYNLNIIGVSHGKTASMTGDNGHRIFVSLGDKRDQVTVRTRINLLQSFDGTFHVLDANGTDGGAIFQLPAPGTYSIWIRALGGPGGKAVITTCVEDLDLGEICSSTNELVVRESGRSRFRNVTTALTTIELAEGSAAALACGATSVSLFDDCLEGYFWAYDNTGLRLLQMRFYREGA
jgi:hypothetical protein